MCKKWIRISMLCFATIISTQAQAEQRRDSKELKERNLKLSCPNPTANINCWYGEEIIGTMAIDCEYVFPIGCGPVNSDMNASCNNQFPGLCQNACVAQPADNDNADNNPCSI